MLLPSSEMKTQAPHIHPLHGATLEPGAIGMAFVSLSSRSVTEQVATS